MKDHGEDFAAKLGRFRTHAGLTQQALANEMGVHRNTIVHWENRTSRPISRGQVFRLADALILTKEERKELLEAANFSIDRWPVEFWLVPFRRDPFFVGRERVFQSLQQLLVPGSMTALTQAISGLGGIGKTHVAVEYAHRFQKDYEAVFWLQANSWEILISECTKLAIELGIPEQEKMDQIIIEIQRWLQKHPRWLLILDNVENPQEILQKFVPTSHHGSVLITTRVQNVDPLALTQVLPTMLEHEGVLFLLRRTKKIALTAGLEETNKDQYNEARQIWQLMDGLPLALDQSGAYILETGCSFFSYQEQYTHRRAKLLLRRGKLSIGHEASVATTFSLAFERVKALNSMATIILQACSLLYGAAIPEEIFQDGAAPLELPLAQDGSLDDALGLLQDFSLVQRNSEGKMLSIHRLVQAVLQDEMNEKEQKYWATRLVQSVATAFPPEVKLDTWIQCERLISQAFACASLIEHMKLVIREGDFLLNQAGVYLDVRGRYEEAKPLYRRALANNELQWGPMHLQTATSLNNLAMLYLAQGDYKQAEPLFKRALAIREKQLGSMHPDIATSLNNLAGLYDGLGMYEKEKPLLKRALAICEKQLGSTHPDTAQTINNLAYLYDHQGKYKEAEPLYLRALAICEKQLGPMHPDTAISLNNLAGLYDNQGKYKEAEPLYLRALAIREKQLEPTDPNIAQSLNNLALLYYDQGKYAQAKPLFERALAIREQQRPIHPDMATTLNNLAMLYEDQGESRQTEPLLKRALAICEEQLGLMHPDTALCLNNLAAFHANQGQFLQAEPLLKQALSVYEHTLGPRHPTTQNCRANYKMLLRQLH